MVRLLALMFAAALLVACAVHPVRPRSTQATPMLDRSGLQADVDVLQRTYAALHPGLYRYNTPASLEAAYAELRAALDHDVPLAEAYLAFSRFAARIRCGHTYANFFNQDDATRAALFERPGRVPFHFRWVGERMIITRNFSGDARLVPGTEVLAIDGVPAAQLLRELMTVARADGGNDGKRIAWLEVRGDEAIEAFDVFLPLFHPEFVGDYTLDARAPTSARMRSRVHPATFAERVAQRPADTDAKVPWSLAIGGDGVAVMTMPTWALYESTWDWKAWLADAFARLDAAHATTLVIDLRANEGGLSVGDELAAHLVAHDTAVDDIVRLVRYRSVPAELMPNLHTWDRSFADWGEATRPYDDRFLRLTRYGDEGGSSIIRPTPRRFAGKVFVLVGPTNSSATFEFANLVKTHHLAMLVGRTTGGNRRGINGGAFFFLRLPHSGIELDVPLIGQFPRTPQPDAGIEPDVVVTPTVAGIAAGIDEDLQAVRRLSTGPASDAGP